MDLDPPPTFNAQPGMSTQHPENPHSHNVGYQHHANTNDHMDTRPVDESSSSLDVTVTEQQFAQTRSVAADSRPPSISKPDLQTFSPASESGMNSRYTSPPSYVPQQQQPMQVSRPPSEMSGSERQNYTHSQPDNLSSYQDQNSRPQSHGDQSGTNKSTIVIKVGMVGDAQIGKTSLMVKYVEGSWDEDYIQTLGVNFMEKTISIRNNEITFSIWDLGGQREFVNMLPLVCNEAVAILFMFDLTRKSTLNSIKEWYRQGRGFNKTAIPFLVGTKYDTFVNFPGDEQEEISNQARRFAKAMKASLIFSSTSHSINVQKIFKIVLSKAFDLKCTIPEIENIGEPLLIYQAVS
ncbi:MAG: hypothetical protein M1814_004179 [Vezdaea aestivalis]|nr:MAG: hypothetical protein M1814_004179 [Vezdaea aestivalis]